MYLVEWMLWQGMVADKNGWASLKGKISRFTPEGLVQGERVAEENRTQPQSGTPRIRSPVYAYNDTYLEMRAGCMEYARGLVTVISIFCLYFISSFFYMAFLAASRLITGTNSLALDITVLITTVAIAFLGSGLYFKYGLQITRLEMLIQRRLLVRFNRKTRQVYLHRPRYAGGIVALPWDSLQVMTDVGGIRFPMVLSWGSDTGRPNPESCFVGKSSATSGPVIDEWEFIRRYMEEGPEGLPQPRIRSKWPLPWHAFEPVFGGMVGLVLGRRDPRHPVGPSQGAKQWALRIIGRLMILVALVMISPALLILGLANWLSQLLCWEPRWPKVIQEAGQPGKSTPKLTEAADYDADTCRRLYLNSDLWTPTEQTAGGRPERENTLGS